MTVLTLHMVAAKEALLALDCGEANAILSFASAMRRTIVPAVLGPIIVDTTAAGRQSTLVQNKFEEWLQSRDT